MTALVAVTRDWGIGKDGDLLFKIPEDQKFFRELTLGNTMIMGRKTLESLPGGKPLPGRRNIVLTGNRDYDAKGAEIAHSPEEAMRMVAGEDTDKVFLIGGEGVFTHMLPLCRYAYVTKIDSVVPADVFFQDLDNTPGWELIFSGEEQSYNGVGFVITKYENMNVKKVSANA